MPAGEWHEAIEQLRPHVFRILTPTGSGTGWIVSRGKASGLCVIATAAHVVAHAHYWEQPIRIQSGESADSILIRDTDRAVYIDEELDTAAIVFEPTKDVFPKQAMRLIDVDMHLKAGVQVGWLGFPGIPGSGLCFFSGHISAYLENSSSYFVDGVAINGVSGGPVFRKTSKGPQVIGLVSAYLPNRASDETLPGLAVLRDVNRYHTYAQDFESLDEARSKQTSPADITVPSGVKTDTPAP